MKLHETLTRDKWIKRRYASVLVGGRGCLLFQLDNIGLSEDEIDAVATVIETLYPERIDVPHNRIARFNDHPATTFEDVVRVLKVAGV